MSTENYSIYAFFDENGVPFYFGYTGNEAVRFQKHLREVKTGNTLPKYRKVNKLLKNGFSFLILVLEKNLTREEAKQKETEYISLAKKYLKKVYNLTSGGDGGDTFSINPNKDNTRKKLRAASLGHSVSEQTRIKLSNTFKGREITWRDKISNILKGRKIPREIVDRIKYKRGEDNTQFKKISQEIKDSIIKKYTEESYTLKKLSSEFNLSYFKIRILLKENNITIVRPKKGSLFLSDVNKKYILETYIKNEKVTVAEISKNINVSHYVVSNFLRNSGVEIRVYRGGSPGKKTPPTEETRIKISLANKGKKLSEKHINKLRQLKHSDETKKLMSENHLIWHNNSYKKYSLTSPNGETHIVTSGLSSFAKEHNLDRCKLTLVAQGKRNHHKNWKCKYILEEDKL